MWHATDFISAAFVLDKPLVARDAAQFVLAHRDNATPAAIDLASRLIHGTQGTLEADLATSSEWSVVVKETRSALREYARDAARWADLGLAHTVCGNKVHAIRCLRIAVNLAKDNRFVLRTAARCFLHWNDPELAHWILRSSERTQTDPWLLAAEIAVASARGRRSSFTSRAKSILSDESIHPHALSELATAFGGVELEHGSGRTAARLFDQALRSPTENSVAQIEWTLNEKRQLSIPGVSDIDVPLLFEAKARERYTAGDWPASIGFADAWHSDQPFSSRPTDLAAYAASLMGDYRLGIAYLEKSLRSNPKDPMILNNIAYFEVLRGNLPAAIEALRCTEGLSVAGDDFLVLQATRGLIEFRKGNHERGRHLYRLTIDKAWTKKKQRVRAIASLNLAREEYLAGDVASAAVLFEESKRAARRFKDKEFQAEVARVEKIVCEGILTGAAP